MKLNGWELKPEHGTDDQATTEGGTIVRTYYVSPPVPAGDVDVYDVLRAFPQFEPGTLVDGRRVGNVSLKNHGSSDEWLRLSVEYQITDYASPLQKPIVWTWESSTLQIPAYVDVKGRPLVTTAGEIIPGLTRPIRLWNIRGTRNIPGVPPWVIESYGESMNSDSVRIDGINFKPTFLQLQKLSIGEWQEEKVGKRNVAFRQMAIEVWYCPLSWRTQVLNRGLVELHIRKEVLETDPDGNPTKTRNVPFQIRATNNAGEDVQAPVFLDKNGLRPRDNDGLIKEQLDPADIVVLKFDLQESLPYGPLIR